MANYVKPQVLVFQEFRATLTEGLTPLRAHISGPNAILHRYADSDEKALIGVGSYDRDDVVNYLWPERRPGSIVDTGYVKLFADDALLMYFEDTIGSDSTIDAVTSYSNRIKSNTVNFKANGTTYPRAAVLLDRDVKVGDRVQLRAVGPEPECEETILDTYVTGFAADEEDATVAAYARLDAGNADTQAFAAADLEYVSTDIPLSGIGATASSAGYDGLEDGDINETYTIEVIQSTIPGCSAARLRVTSASGNDDQAEVTPEDFGEPTDIGTRGLTVTFTADDENTDVLVVGMKWTVVVQQAFEVVFADSAGTYSGAKDDTYIVEVTKGGLWADDPEITVTTAKGLDFSGPTTVTDDQLAVPIGTKGVTIMFFGTAAGADTSISNLGGAVPGLRKGDKFYVDVTSAFDGPYRQLILRDNLPAAMAAAEDMDLRLFIMDDIEISQNRLSDPPNLNWETELTQIVVNDGITAYHEEWTDDGVEQPLTLWSGSLFVQYREWIADLVDEVNAINDVADLDDAILGALDPDNPLKWAVSKALANSNGVAVKYTAVADPTDLDDWVVVLERIKGDDSLYNLVPLTFDRNVQDLYAAHCAAESSAEAGNWKAMFCSLQAVTSRAVVDATSSSDEEIVLATLTDNPQASETQYTLLQVPAANGLFITNGVEAGDIVRFLYTVDGFDEEAYTEFTVDSVISENALLLFTGHSVAVNEPQKIEIWHSLSKTEIAADLATRAGAFSSNRVCAVWPDSIGAAGTNMAGYFAAAALAGEVSGVVPQQGLTNVALLGFDDATRTSKFFNGTQLDNMADAGTWIVTQGPDGTIYTRHGLTTDNVDLSHREEMIRRNLDSISYQFLSGLRDLIGRSNVTDSLLDLMTYRVEALITTLKTQGATQLLGGQLIAGTIRVLQQHPLFLDRVEVVLDLTLPAPTNNIELHLVV